MKSEPTFSILMANYNNGNYIEEAIQSVIDQTYKNWELIIIDDSSNDDSINIIKKFLPDNRIKLITNQRNIGYILTLKKLIDAANADIVGILDSDDALNNDAIETIVNAYTANDKAGFIYSQFIFCNEKLEPEKIGFCRKIPENESNLNNSYTSHFKTFKKKKYFETDGYDPKIMYAEDKDLILKMEEKTVFLFIDKPLYLYRNLPNSQGHDPIKKQIGTINSIQAKYNAHRRRIDSKIPNISNKLMSYDLFIAASLSLKNKAYFNSIKLLFLGIKTSPLNFKGYKIYFLIISKYFLRKVFLKKSI